MKLSNQEMIVLIGIFDLAKEYAGDLNSDEQKLEARIMAQLQKQMLVNAWAISTW